MSCVNPCSIPPTSNVPRATLSSHPRPVLARPPVCFVRNAENCPPPLSTCFLFYVNYVITKRQHKSRVPSRVGELAHLSEQLSRDFQGRPWREGLPGVARYAPVHGRVCWLRRPGGGRGPSPLRGSRQGGLHPPGARGIGVLDFFVEGECRTGTGCRNSAPCAVTGVFRGWLVIVMELFSQPCVYLAG